MPNKYQKIWDQTFYRGVFLLIGSLLFGFILGKFFDPILFVVSVFLGVIAANIPWVLSFKKMACPNCQRHVGWNPILGKWIWGWSIKIPDKCSKCGHILKTDSAEL
ncbi:MAG: hypothetical protein IIA70_03215 [Proteobacteria bacterium]|nr:hypothetical protein [Pseudomonadota bacterium]